MPKNRSETMYTGPLYMRPTYISMVQQCDFACIPACIQMIMHRNGLELLSQGAICKGLGTGMSKKSAKRWTILRETIK
jgi:hypothetical protein